MTQLVPDIVHEQTIALLGQKSTVREAAKMLADRKIGALLVTEGSRLVGIFSERDVVSRVVARGLDPDTTLLQDVMTRDPDTLPPDADVRIAMRLMVQHGYRHLPVLDGHRIVGIVSARDIYTNVVRSIQSGVSALARELLQG